ncbi:MAG: transglutaminase family protein [Opitutales bacterium]|nr:transglutaminase family protein [Opitutales bacterium]NRA26192.1 transglutaminase family protein [Opitutales bacterium]
MHLKISHETRFEYSAATTNSYNEARLCPVVDRHQSLLAYQLAVVPAGSRRQHVDFYLNTVDTFEVVEAHSSLCVIAQSEVETYPPKLDMETQLRGMSGRAEDHAGEFMSQETWEFLLETQLVPKHPDLWKLGIDAADGQANLWEEVIAILDSVYKHLNYDPASTRVKTSAVEALEGGSGVCQDYAHVFLGVSRALKIPARYVSGYLFIEDQMNDIETLSALASHAWVEVCFPGFGWIALDPTHNRLIDERYVTVARGRDYADARPLSGAYMGASTGKMEVEVKIERMN